MQLFQKKAPKGKRVYRVESLNREKGISSVMRLSEDGKRYVTILCLPHKTKYTVWLDEEQAKNEMAKYRALYKEIKKGI